MAHEDDPHVTIRASELQAIRDTLALIPELVRGTALLAGRVERLERLTGFTLGRDVADPGGAPLEEIVEVSPSDPRCEPSEPCTCVGHQTCDTCDPLPPARPRSITPPTSTPAAVLRNLETASRRARTASQQALAAAEKLREARAVGDSLMDAIAERELGRDEER
jgi:hypothetical protein